MTSKTTTWHPWPLDVSGREGQLEKTIAYAQALQYWVEKANLPMAG